MTVTAPCPTPRRSPLQLNRGDWPSTKQHLLPSGSLDSAVLCLPPPHWTEVKPHGRWLVTWFPRSTRHTGDSGSAPLAGMEPIKERTTSNSPVLSPGWDTRQRSSILVWGMWTPKAKTSVGFLGGKHQQAPFQLTSLWVLTPRPRHCPPQSIPSVRQRKQAASGGRRPRVPGHLSPSPPAVSWAPGLSAHAPRLQNRTHSPAQGHTQPPVWPHTAPSVAALAPRLEADGQWGPNSDGM